MLKFLCSVYQNFKLKFDDLKLRDTKDQLLFEDFIQFISTYIFRNNEGIYINIWNETFIPMNKEEKKNKFSMLMMNNYINGMNFKYHDNLDQIEIFDETKDKTIIIDEEDIYAFQSLCSNIINNNEIYD